MNLNFSLHPAQMQIFQEKSRYRVVSAGRRFGKSLLAAVELLIEGLKDTDEHGNSLRNERVFYVAPTLEQGKRIMWNVLKDMGKDVIKKTIENQAIIELINGRIIEIKGSDRPDTLRGVGLSYVVLDEYAFMKPDVWELILLPALTRVKGRALFIGTPEGKNHFYKLWKEADTNPEYTAFQFNSTDNPFLPAEEIEAARERMSAQAFRQEFEASFEASGGGVFLEDYIKFDEKEPEGGQYFITVDPASFDDYDKKTKTKSGNLDDTAIAIVKVGPYGWWVREIDYGRWGIRETSLRILKHAKEVKATIVGIEQIERLMGYMEEQMQRLNVFPRIEKLSHGGKKKTDRIAWALQGRFQHGRIKLNKGHWNRKFLDQYLDFPNPLSHDDLLDALAYIDQIALVNFNTELVIDEFEPLDEVTGV